MDRDPTRFGSRKFSSSEGSVSRDELVEELLCGGWDKSGAVSSASGAFELTCLMVRSYQVLAYDPRTAMRAGPWTLEAGLREVVLTLPPEPDAQARLAWGPGDAAPSLSGDEHPIDDDCGGTIQEDGRYAQCLLIASGRLPAARRPLH